MTRRTPIAFLTAAAVSPLTVLAVIGGANIARAGTTHRAIGREHTVSATAVTRTSSRPTLRLRRTSLGKIVVDSSGQTLYLFKKDRNGKSSCSGSCAVNWPPLIATRKPTAGIGVSASKLSTTRRSDGTKQVVYNGHPLYSFIGDSKPGDTTGEGLAAFGARWFVVSPAGNEVK